MTSITLHEQSIKENTPLNEESNKVISNEEKLNEIYFIILYQRKEKELEKDFVFTKYETKPEKIYSMEKEGQNGIYFYEKVFKLKRKSKKKEESKKHEDAKSNEDSKKKKEKKKEEETKIGKENKKKEKKKKKKKNKKEKKE